MDSSKIKSQLGDMIYQIFIKDIKISSDIDYQLEDRIGPIFLSLNQQGHKG